MHRLALLLVLLPGARFFLLDAYGWLPGPPWLLHDWGRSAFGPVH
jgi:hypothetical protein